MQNQNTIQIKIKDEIPDTHYFVYKNKKFPFKFDFFKHSSKFISNNQYEIDKTQEILLVDKDSENQLNFTDDIIISFIKYVQRQEITLNNENVTGLNYLAKKYEVPSLIESTNEFIKIH